MNRKDYIYHLKNRLRNLPKEEIDNAVEYVNEMFDEAGVENETLIIEELGSPAKFAAQIKAEFTINQQEGEDVVKKSNGWKSLLMILLGIMALPVGLPLLIVIACFGFTIILILGILLFLAVILIISLVVIIFAVLYSGIRLLSASLGAGLILIGCGLLGISGAVLLIVGLIFCYSKLKPVVINGFGWIYHKLKGGVDHE